MYGVSDLASVRAYGYHLPPWVQGGAPQLASSLPADALSVLDGTASAYAGRPVPAGGCRSWASDQLTGRGIDPSTGAPADPTADALADQIQTSSFEQAQS